MVIDNLILFWYIMNNVFHLQVGSLVLLSISTQSIEVPCNLVPGASYKQGTSYEFKLFHRIKKET